MKSAETCNCSLCNKFYTYLYHHIVVLDKYTHSNIVYYKRNGDDESYDSEPKFVALDIQQAMRMRHIVICVLPRSVMVFNIMSQNWRIFEKKKKSYWTNNVCFDFL